MMKTPKRKGKSNIANVYRKGPLCDICEGKKEAMDLKEKNKKNLSVFFVGIYANGKFTQAHLNFSKSFV